MKRAILVALAGLGYFVVSLPMMIPLRMSPIENYNLFYMPFLAVMFFFLLYKTCAVEKESKAYVYGFFTGIFLWQLAGEVASMPVPAGIIEQFSNVDIKIIGGYFYVLIGWVMLKIMWRTKALKNSVCVFLLTFLSLWTFELYMDNYSFYVPLDIMATVAYIITVVFVLISILLLYVAKKAATLEKKTVMGCLLYITISVIIMAPTEWTTPSAHYVQHEAANIEREIAQLKEDRIKIQELQNWMIERGILEPEAVEEEPGTGIPQTDAMVPEEPEHDVRAPETDLPEPFGQDDGPHIADNDTDQL